MFIHLRELSSQGNVAVIHEQIHIDSLLKGLPEVVNAMPLQVDLEAKQEGEEVLVLGQLSTKIVFACSRCLTEFKQDVVVPFRERFVLSENVQSIEKDEELVDESEEIHFVRDSKVDLEPYVIETIMLGLPFIPLCNDACRGLCSVCGTNLNEHSCDCKQEKVDPRLAGLADYFKK